MIVGSCLCKDIQFQFPKTEGDYVYCHCPSCRKASGAAFRANVSVPIETFNIYKGKESLKVFESSPGKMRHFCNRCGSPLFTLVGSNPVFARVRLGSIDSEFTQLPAAHIFMSQKASWDRPDLDIPCFDDWPALDSVSIRGSHQPKT